MNSTKIYKRLVLCVLGFFLFYANMVWAQSPQMNTLTIFTEMNTPFTLFVNGEQINQTPKTHVSTETHFDFVSVVILFKEGTPQIRKELLRVGPVGQENYPYPYAAAYKIVPKQGEEFKLKLLTSNRKKLAPAFPPMQIDLKEE